MKFDPARDRQNLDEFGIPHARESQFAEALELKALAGFGHSILLTGLECFLLGKFEVGRELASKAENFLRAAIEHKEIPRQYARGGTEANRLVGFARCHWFLSKQHDLKSLKEAVRWKEIWFEDLGESWKTEVQLTLPFYLEAEEYETLFHRFEQGKLTPPKKLRNIKGEGTMSYVLARHRLGLEYSADEVKAALDSFFKRNMRSEWLNRGLFTSVATWMKIAFWKPGDDPIATLLKCYDYLPDLQRPRYPAQSSASPANSGVIQWPVAKPTKAGPLEREFCLAAYWPGRSESVEDCAGRLAFLLEELATVDPFVANWYEAGARKKGTKQIDAANPERLLKLLTAHSGKAESTAFHVELSNGSKNGDAIDLRIACGSRSERVGNSVELVFPAGLAPLASVEKMSAVLAAVVRAWEPEWAGVQSREALQLRPVEAGQPFVDWMLYLCRERCPNGATLHHPARLHALGGRLGVIVITQDEPPDPRNPEHLANIERARMALGL
jgi:hypothetical protein